MGLLLDHRRAIVLLAADPGAAVRAAISRRPRGCAPRRDESLPPLLASAETALSRHAARQGLARRARYRPASLWRDRNRRTSAARPARPQVQQSRFLTARRHRTGDGRQTGISPVTIDPGV